MTEDKIFMIIGTLFNSIRGEFELVDLKINQDDKGCFAIYILADKPQGGITLDDCTSLNKAFTKIFEKREINCAVSVSSPGVDRPLKTSNDFSRVLPGVKIKFLLKEKVNGETEYIGTLKTICLDKVIINTNNEYEFIYFDNIIKAVQIL